MLFEHGLRACINQELSMLELKIVVCLVVWNFDISTMDEEWSVDRTRLLLLLSTCIFMAWPD